MNRSEELRSRLDEWIGEFNSYRQYDKRRSQFFDAISSFQKEVDNELRRSKIVRDEDIACLDTLFTEIFDCRTKCQGADGVYWPRVDEPFNQIPVTLQRIRQQLGHARVPLRLQVLDWLRTNWMWLVGIIVAVVLAVWGAMHASR
jgi:hypothetical protein